VGYSTISTPIQLEKTDTMDKSLRVILPIIGGIIIVLFMFIPGLFDQASDTVKKILPKPNQEGVPEEGMMRWEELEQAKRYASLSEALQNPDEVRVLDLSNQNLNEIPAEIAKLKKLQLLELQNNKIEYIPKEIGELKYLQYLYLSKNRIVTLPAEIGKLEYLSVLDLTSNHIRALPEGIGKCTYLRELDLRNNQLISLNLKIGNLYRLKILRLGTNRLSQLPVEITKLDSLKLLDLSNNRNLDLRETFTTISKIPNLQDLEFNQQGMRIIPKAIAELRKLKLLSLRGNKLSTAEKQNARNLLPNTEIDF
jgi:leucine-rich repeat protein SHOC2